MERLGDVGARELDDEVFPFAARVRAKASGLEEVRRTRLGVLERELGKGGFGRRCEVGERVDLLDDEAHERFRVHVEDDKGSGRFSARHVAIRLELDSW